MDPNLTFILLTEKRMKRMMMIQKKILQTQRRRIQRKKNRLKRKQKRLRHNQNLLAQKNVIWKSNKQKKSRNKRKKKILIWLTQTTFNKKWIFPISILLENCQDVKGNAFTNISTSIRTFSSFLSFFLESRRRSKKQRKDIGRLAFNQSTDRQSWTIIYFPSASCTGKDGWS